MSSSSSPAATQSTVEGIKQSLSKLLPADSLSPQGIEQCKDMFQQLEQCNITLEILTKTLIGTVVSKFKSHEEIGFTAKSLVKKWKKVATSSSASAPATTKATSTAAATATATKPRKVASATTTTQKAERRESISQALAEAELEWAGLQPHRNTTVKKLHSFMLASKPALIRQGINSNAIEHIVIERATEVEMAMHKKFSNNKPEYLNKARSLCFNIKKNVALTTQIVLGQIEPKELVDMSSEQLASDEKRKEMEERARKILDTGRLDWEQANEDKINAMCGIEGELLKASLFTCGRCKSTKTTSTQKQTRSADEPMTVFVLCLNCGKRWKC